MQEEQLRKLQETLQVEKERLAVEQQSIRTEEQRVAQERSAEEARLRRLTPHLYVRVVETQGPVRAFIHFRTWLTVSPIDVRFKLLPARIGTDVRGMEVTPPVLTSPNHDIDLPVADVGWRWKWQSWAFDSVEYEVQVLTQDMRKLKGSGLLQYADGQWREVLLADAP